jgi:Flp pilus assembly protein TadG
MKITISEVSVIKTLWRRLADDRCGAAMVEFALAVPLFSALFIGMVQGGILLFDEIELANAANVGSRAFAVSRQPTCNPTCTTATTPATSTVNAIENSGSLTLGPSNITLSVGSPAAACFNPGDTPSADDGTATSGCLGALNSAFNSTNGSYYSAAANTTVKVTFPCTELLPLSWMPLTGVCAGGNLSVTMSQQVQ